MVDSSVDLRIKNKLEKQDEIEVSDEEEAVGGLVDAQRSRSTKKGSPAPTVKPTERLLKQISAPVHSDRSAVLGPSVKTHADSQMRKSSMPVAYVHMPEQGTLHMRNELTAPRHLGSMAFSSMSTEESSIADLDPLNRQMGMLSVQGSLQDELYGGERKTSLEDFPAFLLATWHRHANRDRENMLNFERILEDMLVRRQDHKYFSPPLNSYYRMLFHRMADVWGFEHVPESIKGQAVVSVRWLPDSRRPDQLFRDLDNQTIQEEESPSNFFILKRPKNHSLPETTHVPAPRVAAAMSLEERQANYARVREQIFGQDDSGNDGEATPQPYGLPPNYDAGHSQTSQAAYNRSRSVQSDVSSEANYDPAPHPMRPMYGDPYGGGQLVRPMMQGPSLYGTPYGYAAGVMGYPNPDGTSYMDPGMYQQMQQLMAAQQQHFYQQTYGHAAYGQSPANALYPGMQFAPPAYPHPAYSPQGSFDQQIPYNHPGQYYQTPPQQAPPYNQLGDTGAAGPSSQPGYGHSGPPVSDHRLHGSAQDYSSPGNDTALRSMPPNNSSSGGPRYPHSDYTSNTGETSSASPALNDAFIIPLRFPPVVGGVGNPSSQLGMFLKLPCGRPPAGGDGGGSNGRRMSRNNSGRSSLDRQNSGSSPGGSGSGGKSQSQGGDYSGAEEEGKKEQCRN